MWEEKTGCAKALGWRGGGTGTGMVHQVTFPLAFCLLSALRKQLKCWRNNWHSAP